MFLRAKSRLKDGKVHRYWSIVENRRTRGNRIVQRQVLYLGEINDNQQAAWCKTIEVLQEGQAQPQAVAIFPEDRIAPVLGCEIVSIKLSELQLHRPRQWGACWLAYQLWDQLRLGEVWADKLPASRQGTRWLNVFKTLVCYRLIDPGSEWRLHRHWYEQSAMGDLLGEDFGLVQIDKLYRCSDKLLPHKEDLFTYLKQRWQALFEVGFEVLLYDWTSTSFESDPPEEGKRKFGYSRDKCPDCVQVVIALIVTADGFPLAYEIRAGQYPGQDYLGRLSEEDRETIRKSPAHLGDGPRDTDGRDPEPNARGPDPHSLSRGHTQGAFEQTGKSVSQVALGPGPRVGGGQADRASGRALYPGKKCGPGAQGALDASAAIETALQTPARAPTTKTDA